MLEAYSSGDPYLAFGKQAGRIPQHGTKESHLQVREQFKTCALGVQYGMKARSLATRIDGTILEAERLLLKFCPN